MSDSYLITGGAGFIGTNLADHYLSQGKRVTIFDSFARVGSAENAAWLSEKHGDAVRVVTGDVRWGQQILRELVEEIEVLYHLAAQVAVTTSVSDPRADFEINAFGTFNVLEAVRLSSSQPIVIYSSTNKVYGEMVDLGVTESDGRYAYADGLRGIPESRPLDFHSPYGCSKGAGDQYVIDYARIYGLKTVVLRQSCIYGPRQYGIEDQGWLAWFAIRAMMGRPVTVYGDGKQIRDVLYVDDLIRAYDVAIEQIERTRGQAYNIGGGPENTLSLLELIEMLGREFGRPLEHSFADWRPGDQRVYVSDIRKAKQHFGWSPMVGVTEGVKKLVGWLDKNRSHFDQESALVAPGALNPHRD